MHFKKNKTQTSLNMLINLNCKFTQKIQWKAGKSQSSHHIKYPYLHRTLRTVQSVRDKNMFSTVPFGLVFVLKAIMQ